MSAWPAPTPGLILLTATPEQLGRSGHFARLRLLDSARYRDLEQYQHEADGYLRLSDIVEKLQNAQNLTVGRARPKLAARLRDDPQPCARRPQTSSILNVDAAATDSAVLDALIDRHGTGRSLFRNRRAVVGGFPKPRAGATSKWMAQLLNDDQRQHLLAEFLSDVQQPLAPLELNYADDPRLPWLLGIAGTTRRRTNSSWSAAAARKCWRWKTRYARAAA